MSATTVGESVPNDLGLSVVVMAYNEAGNLALVTREIAATLATLGCTWEILIIDDGSADGTGELTTRLRDEVFGVRVLHHLQNQGLGGVYRTGFAEARGRWVTFFPADGQFPASIISQFYPLMADADMVLGYLFQRRRSLLAELLSFVERVLYRIILGPLPKFQGIMMFRRDLLNQVTLYSKGRGWAVLMEFILRVVRAGYRVESIPTEIRPRLSGVSKVNNWRTIWANFKQVLALRRYL